MVKRIITIAFSKDYEDEYYYLMRLGGNRSEWVRQAVRQRIANDKKHSNAIDVIKQRIAAIEKMLKHDVAMSHTIPTSNTGNVNDKCVEKELLDAVSIFEF